MANKPAANLVRLALSLLLLTSAATSLAYDRTLGIGTSYGQKISEDTDFWGWTVDYAFRLDSGWWFAASLAWDEETERRRNKPDKVVRSYTPTFAWSHPVSPRWTLAAGFGKGIYNDDNDEGEYKWVDLDKEWAVGTVATFNLFQSGRHAVNVSTSLEYDISEGAPQVSVDIAYAWGF